MYKRQAAVKLHEVYNEALGINEGYVVSDEYRWNGYDQGHKRDQEHAKDIANQFAITRQDIVVLDPSAYSLRMEFRRLGQTTIKGNNKIIPGIEYTTKALSEGKVKIYEKCNYLLGEMGEYVWDEKGVKPVKANDHFCDALRYAVVHARNRLF